MKYADSYNQPSNEKGGREEDIIALLEVFV
jgi:hypothetical protein